MTTLFNDIRNTTKRFRGMDSRGLISEFSKKFKVNNGHRINKKSSIETIIISSRAKIPLSSSIECPPPPQAHKSQIDLDGHLLKNPSGLEYVTYIPFHDKLEIVKFHTNDPDQHQLTEIITFPHISKLHTIVCEYFYGWVLYGVPSESVNVNVI